MLRPEKRQNCERKKRSQVVFLLGTTLLSDCGRGPFGGGFWTEREMTVYIWYCEEEE